MLTDPSFPLSTWGNLPSTTVLIRCQFKHKNAKMTDNRLVYCIRRYKIQLSFKTTEKSKIPRATSICTCCFRLNKALSAHLGAVGPPHLCISLTSASASSSISQTRLAQLTRLCPTRTGEKQKQMHLQCVV